MRAFSEGDIELSWGGSGDISPEMEGLELEGSWIEPPRLLRVAAFAGAADRIRKTLTRVRATCPRLYDLAGTLAPFPEIVAEVGRCITGDGEVADGASPELRRLRRDLEQARRDIIRTLERMLRDRSREKAIQEPIVTLRQDRYVIPVRAGSRGAVPGIVHDRSASGQTLFIEPQGVVAANNRLRELTAMEREEVLRILRELADAIRERGADLRAAMSTLGELEAVAASAAYAARTSSQPPEITVGEGPLDVREARHPILWEKLGSAVVPMDLNLGETRTLVLTGPNTGGKTVALKTVGLLCLMAQSGLQIPAAAGSVLPCFTDILADIGDEQSIEQNLSTFSGHMKNIIAVLEGSRESSLVLLDELGAGTDPAEGAALAIAILEEVHSRGARTVATTHHNAITVFASVTEGVSNASMEFNGETLEPTYRLRIGVPGRSQALHIASRLGMKQEVIDRARRQQSSGELRLESLMNDLEDRRRDLERQEGELQKKKTAAAEEQLRRDAKWRRKVEKLEKEGRKSLRRAEEELAAHMKTLRKQPGQPGVEVVRQAMKRVDGVVAEYRPPAPPAKPVGPVSPGDTVMVRTLRAWGVVEEVGAQGLTVTVDGKRCSIPLAEITERRPAAKEAGKRTGRRNFSVDVPPVTSSQIDLRGLRAEEALTRLERFIEHALLNGMPDIAIVHGKGTGRLQEAVAGLLAGHSRVENFSLAPLEQGGAGMTRARLAV